MRGIGVTLLLLIISVKILRPQSQSRQEIVVPAATPLAAESTPARLPVGTLKAHPTEITVPAANSSAAQATALPTEKATKPDAAEIREAKQSDTISKDEV